MWGCMKSLSLISVLPAVDDNQLSLLCGAAAHSADREAERRTAKWYRQQDLIQPHIRRTPLSI